MYLPSAKRDLSFLFFIFPHDIKYQEKYIYITERKDTMLRFKKMDCWQECNFPSSKSPIGFHTLQGFSTYTREIGGGLWEWSYWPLSKFKHISGSGHCLRWLYSWILILLDEILQYNRIWQFSYGRRPFPHDTCGSWAHPATSTQCWMDGVWTGKQFLVVFLSHPSQGDPALTPVVPSPSWEKPQRGTQQQPYHFLEESSTKDKLW